LSFKPERPLYPLVEYCEPHDILKVSFWTRHGDPSLLPKLLTETSLAKAVREHHEKRWMSDKLAAAIARPFFDSVDYVKGDLDFGTLFFIPVYEPEGRLMKCGKCSTVTDRDVVAVLNLQMRGAGFPQRALYELIERDGLGRR